jgi:alcohol dehydrogenase
VTDLPEPILGTGEVLVDVHVSPVLSYARDIVSGVRVYPLELPAALGGGAIGTVRSVGPDSTSLSVGEWVYCDPTVRARDNRATPDIMLQGIIAPTEGAMRLRHYHRHGSWAEVVRVPTENVTPLGAMAPEDAERWSVLGRLLVPYGGLLAGDLKAGETVLVNGATGAFGSDISTTHKASRSAAPSAGPTACLPPT